MSWFDPATILVAAQSESTNEPEQLPARLSEPQLLERFRRGDVDSFAELVRRYEGKLLRVIYRMVNDRQAAEDLAQETFLKVFDRFAQFDPARRFGPWLFQIGINAAVDWLRRHRRQNRPPAPGEPVTVAEIAVEDPRGAIDRLQEVRHVLEQIPLEFRTVLILRDLEGMACSEIAAIVGRKEPTVRWRLLKGREMFRRLWERRENPER
jgi:RNA polymerase sigma-70 factor (ECF subfamily)